MAGMVVYSLYYNHEYNMFEDLEGWPIYDIHKYITPSELLLLKDGQGTLYRDGPPGVIYEIIVPILGVDESDYHDEGGI